MAKKKIKDLTLEECIKFCETKNIEFCQKKCPLRDICFNQFCDSGFDIEKEVEVND